MRLSLIYSLFIVPYFLCCNLSKSEEIDKILPYFQIFTTINKSFEKVDTKILKNCEIDKYFQLKNEKNKGNVYDDSSIFRRVLRFHLNTPQKNRTSTKKQLNIEISSKIEGGAGEVIIPKNKFVLPEGELFDSFISYKCNNHNVYSIKNNFFKIHFFILVNNENLFSFQINKICTDIQTDSVDISHIILIFVSVFIIYISSNLNLYSNFEDTFLNKFPELRNPENFSIILLTVFLILWCLYMINGLIYWSALSSIIIIPSSFAMICELAINVFQIKENLPIYFFENTIFGLFSIHFLIIYGLGCLIYFIYFISSNWVVCDILSISFCIGVIRLIKFTSFKHLLFISCAIWIYDLLWCLFESTFFTTNSRLGFETNFILPFFIYVPEFNFIFYKSYIYLPITDVIISGTLINYCRRIDKKIKLLSNFYFLVSTGGFLCAIIIRILVYSYLFIPTPCFVYIYPSIMIPILASSYYKGELKEFLIGFKETVFAENEMESQVLNNFANYAYAESNISMTSSLEMKFI